MKKNDSNTGRLIFWDPGKFVLKMKLTFLFMLLGIIQTFALKGYSQSAKLTMDLRNVSVVEVLRVIEDQSDYYFVYNKDAIDLDRKVDLEAKGLDIKEILDFISKNRCSYQSPAGISSCLQLRFRAFSSHYRSAPGTDSDGPPLPGVTVIIKIRLREYYDAEGAIR
jgi:hypothetical protein